MVGKRHLRALRAVYEALSGREVRWALTGSLSFALQGAPVEPDDIDIQTDREGAYEIQRALHEHVTRRVEFSSSAAGGIRSHFGELRIGGVRVEVMGDVQKRLPDGSWEAPVALERHTRRVEVEGMSVPVLALEYEAAAYRRLGRLDTARMLEEMLEKENRERGEGRHG
ncbi:conserved hypothetical protein [Rubrobacter xylanophilus DSM 9941]|uniref:Uncharacterized protein n=1 Tax=Rubrobacter xylanophilus (strain DSM 9941 / JCM 11954 / NBRC 16129 / PRD-1) TaxID=266117 RepID=Q1AYD2_RUBXD|nr:hypothetical protein [Rubrobacter xylanophilus]ABG03596.1 conserved hypothetical protein [Rubrobacter xylanophilus DSM 9941]